MNQQEGSAGRLNTVLWQGEERGPIATGLWENFCQRVGGIWISRSKTFVKVLRWRRMLYVPGKRDTVTVLAKAGR